MVFSSAAGKIKKDEMAWNCTQIYGRVYILVFVFLLLSLFVLVSSAKDNGFDFPQNCFFPHFAMSPNVRHGASPIRHILSFYHQDDRILERSGDDDDADLICNVGAFMCVSKNLITRIDDDADRSPPKWKWFFLSWV